MTSIIIVLGLAVLLYGAYRLSKLALEYTEDSEPETETETQPEPPAPHPYAHVKERYVEAMSEPGREIIGKSGDVTFYRCGKYTDAIRKGTWYRADDPTMLLGWRNFPAGDEAPVLIADKLRDQWQAMQRRKEWGVS